MNLIGLTLLLLFQSAPALKQVKPPKAPILVDGALTCPVDYKLWGFYFLPSENSGKDTPHWTRVDAKVTLAKRDSKIHYVCYDATSIPGAGQ